MKKSLFLLLAILVSLTSFGRVLDIYNLDYGDNSPYEDGFWTMTSDWESAGWGFGENIGAPTAAETDGEDLSQFSKAVFELEESAGVAFQVKVRYYSAGAQQIDYGTTGNPSYVANWEETNKIIPKGTSSFFVELDETWSSNVLAIYLQQRAKGDDPDGGNGTLYFQSADLISEALTEIPYYSFDIAELGKCYPSAQLDLSLLEEFEGVTDLPTSVAKVAAAPGGRSGNALHIVPDDYNETIALPITLPVGTTFADVENIKFDVYNPTETDMYKKAQIVVGDEFFASSGYPLQAAAASWQRNSISASDLNFASTANVFTLYLGITTGPTQDVAEYYLDNIAITLKGTVTDSWTESNLSIDCDGGSSVENVNSGSSVKVYSIAGGLAIEGGEGAVVYGVDGSIITSTAASSIALPRGVYFVKVGSEVVKAIVK